MRGAAGWRELGRTSKTKVTSAADASFTDTTAALTKDGAVGFTLPTPPVADDEGCWLRVWIAAGDYGKPVTITPNSRIAFAVRRWAWRLRALSLSGWNGRPSAATAWLK